MFMGNSLHRRKIPTDYYCEEISAVDEQICSLIAKRKEISNNNPGFPPLETITAWCQAYDLNEQIVYGIFHSLYHAADFIEFIEPVGFLKFIPILKTVEENRVLYSITHMKQYSNASVVFVEVENKELEPNINFGHTMLELTISSDYKCRMSGGCGYQTGALHSFIITPPLPDDVSGISFRLTVKPMKDFLDIKYIPSEEVTVTFN